MERRTFIKTAGAVTLALTCPELSWANAIPKRTKRITILHTNDTHSHIDPMPANDPSMPNQGGVARRATLIKKIREENPNTLLFDGGDIFQGTPYFNIYGGELEFRLMSMLGYDAATIGNHDFDNGLEGLYKVLPHAKFEFISSNYDFSKTILKEKVLPYKIYHCGGVKIGVFGLGIKLEGLVNKQMYQETVYHHPLEVAQTMEHTLRYDHRCDLVICLSHLGYDYPDKTVISDLNIAAQTSEIDLIIGGHTHTFLSTPTYVTNKKGTKTIVNQAGCYGLNLGQIDFYIKEKDINEQPKIETTAVALAV